MMRNEDGQLQLVEVITVAVIIFTAIAISSVFRLPTSPGTFQESELERIGADALRILANTVPKETADCNEPTFCPFLEGSELERMFSLALAYAGPTGPAVETADRGPLSNFLEQALPEGVRYIVYYSNGVNATKVVPLARTPPTLDVSVAHAFLTPNWTAFSANLAESVLLRIGEPTAFGTPTEIRDPLNRTQTEFGYDLGALYAETTPAVPCRSGAPCVPHNATLGTHILCYASDDCHYFTVTPPGIFGAGSQILPGDRDNSTAVKELGDFGDWVHYMNDGSGFGMNAPLYIDADSSAAVSAGDLRVSAVDAPCKGPLECRGGTNVVVTDGDVGGSLLPLNHATSFGLWKVAGGDKNVNGNFDVGEAVYFAETGDDQINIEERRLSRVGVYPMGSQVATDDEDEGADLSLAFTAKIRYDDVNNNNALDPGEAAYVDLAGAGVSDGLSAGDLHLNSKGNPTARYVYDIRLVVWFGV